MFHHRIRKCWLIFNTDRGVVRRTFFVECCFWRALFLEGTEHYKSGTLKKIVFGQVFYPTSIHLSFIHEKRKYGKIYLFVGDLYSLYFYFFFQNISRVYIKLIFKKCFTFTKWRWNILCATVEDILAVSYKIKHTLIM